MIAPALVDEVKRLLVLGRMSQRKIARHTGVSRASVGLIAAGKRTERSPAKGTDFDWPEPIGPLARCPSCGGKVLLPCLLCYVRRAGARG